MQNTDTVESAETSVAKTLIKEAVIATAITVGALTGAVMIGLAAEKFKQIRADRAAQEGH